MSALQSIQESITAAVAEGKLLSSSADNIKELLEASSDPISAASIQELVDAGEWSELNDRFFKKLAFGTGGLRGRTIGRIVTKAEQGNPQPLDRPEFPCVGTNNLNFFNLSRATQGLVAYIKEYLKNDGSGVKPSMVFAHDTRHFHAEFVDLCAKVCVENGVDVYRFTEPRSTPELSFAVRHLGCQAGVMLTASHNPPHDNGYKAYFADGGQIVEPHASSIIEKVNAVDSDQYKAVPKSEWGTVTEIGEEIDNEYMATLETLMLQPELLEKAKGLKIVFTNLHGTGGKIVRPMLERLKFDFLTVPEQDVEDGRFPTVESPNPENAPALAMGIDLAEKENGDIVIGTDPDCDRMGVAVRDQHGKMILLTGNEIGSLMGYYRIKTMFDQGILNAENKSHAVLVKTFVTTELQRAVAESFGINCVNTLTGFKYIGAKLQKYESQIPENECTNYRALSAETSRNLRLKHSQFFVFGGEESYGYLGADVIRDKDGNGAVVMFAELAAYAKSLGLTLPELMDQVYQEFGYYTAKLKSLVFEGAEGAAKIAKLAASYSADPPKELDGSVVTNVRNFAEQDFVDEEGDAIPKEKMIFVDLEDGRSFAVRPSGTEPKIKYYLYGKRSPGTGRTFSPDELATAKAEIAADIDSLWASIEKNIDDRLA